MCPTFLNDLLVKKANTVILDKEGNINDVTNWRPLSICSVVRKAYEKILDMNTTQYIKRFY